MTDAPDSTRRALLVAPPASALAALVAPSMAAGKTKRTTKGKATKKPKPPQVSIVARVVDVYSGFVSGDPRFTFQINAQRFLLEENEWDTHDLYAVVPAGTVDAIRAAIAEHVRGEIASGFDRDRVQVMLI